MNRLFAAAAIAPMLLVSGAFAQAMPEEVGKQLWCGTAMVTFFSDIPTDQLSPDEQKEAKSYIDGGKALIDLATQAALDAGVPQDEVDKLKTDLQTIVMEEINSDTPSFGFDECLEMLPGVGDDSASSEASPEATDPSASSAM